MYLVPRTEKLNWISEKFLIHLELTEIIKTIKLASMHNSGKKKKREKNEFRNGEEEMKRSVGNTPFRGSAVADSLKPKAAVKCRLFG